MNGKGIVLAGTITDIFPAEVYGQFEKRVIWLKQPDSEKYPEHWAVEFWQGDGNQLDKFKRGDVVTCKIDIKGKQYNKNGKSGVIVCLKCWAIERQGTTQQQPSAGAYSATQRQPNPTAATGSTSNRTGGGSSTYLDEPLDDLPF